MGETDKVLIENLKKTKFACQVEAARKKMREAERINVKPAKPGKVIEIGKYKEYSNREVTKKDENPNRALFSEKTRNKYMPSKDKGKTSNEIEQIENDR